MYLPEVEPSEVCSYLTYHNLSGIVYSGTILFLERLAMSNQQSADDVHRATVTKVEDSYVVTLLAEATDEITTRESVTFRTSNWQGKRPPEVGQVVELLCIELYASGWRAAIARPVMLTSNSNQQGKVK